MSSDHGDGAEARQGQQDGTRLGNDSMNVSRFQRAEAPPHQNVALEAPEIVLFGENLGLARLRPASGPRSADATRLRRMPREAGGRAAPPLEE